MDSTNYDDIRDSISFFINHATKTTTWEDPRPMYYAQQQRSPVPSPQQPQRSHVPSPQQPQRSPRPSPQPQRSPRATRPAETIPMQTLSSTPKCRTCKEKEVWKAGHQCYDCQVKDTQRQAALRRAQEAEEEEVRRRQGQQKISQTQKQRRIQSAKKRGGQRSNLSVDFEETTFTNDSAAQQPAAAAVREVSAAEKTALKLNLKAKYPKHPEFLIEMALEASGYDREKTEAVLSVTKSPKPVRKGKDSAGSSRGATPSDVLVNLPTSTAAVVFEQSENTKAVVFGDDTTSSSSSSDEEPPQRRTTTKPEPKKSVTITTTITTQPRARPVQSRPKPTKVTYGINSTGYKSLLCCKPEGHDTSIVKGPDRDLLISSYTSVSGPNKQYSKGPDASNVAGPMRRPRHKKESLACGPQALLQQGPQYELAVGTANS